MPSGEVGYIMPDSGLIYLPERSKAEGRSVFTQNPKPQMEAQRQEEERRQAQIDLANKQASPGGQALQVGLGIAGTAGGLALANSSLLQPPLAAAQTQQILSTLPGAAAAAPAAAPVAAAAPVTQTAGSVAASAATGAPYAVGSAPLADGTAGILMSDGAVVAPQAASGFSLSGIGAAGNYILPAAGAYGAYDLFNRENGAGRGALQGAASGAAIGSYFGMPLVGAGIGGAIGLAESFFDNPSTKELEKERWGNLADAGVVDAQAAFLANHPPGDTSIYQEGPRKGQKWKFENALEDAKKDPNHFRLVFGNYDTFGNDWSTYTPEQQLAITGRLANEGLYAGRKGDVVITDKERARKIKDEVLSGATAPSVTPELAAQTQGVTQKPLMGAPATGKLPAGINAKALPMGQGQAPAAAPGLTYAAPAAQGAPVIIPTPGTMGQVSPNNVSPSNGPLTLRQAQQPTRVDTGRTPLNAYEKAQFEKFGRLLAERMNAKNKGK
jgi:hypothetical protein